MIRESFLFADLKNATKCLKQVEYLTTVYKVRRVFLMWRGYKIISSLIDLGVFPAFWLK